jgi:hypothetical protein
MLDLNNVEVHKLSPPHKKQVSHRNVTFNCACVSNGNVSQGAS